MLIAVAPFAILAIVAAAVLVLVFMGTAKSEPTPAPNVQVEPFQGYQIAWRFDNGTWAVFTDATDGDDIIAWMRTDRSTLLPGLVHQDVTFSTPPHIMAKNWVNENPLPEGA